MEVFRMEDFSIAFTGHLKGKLYLVDFTSNRVNPETCLMAKSSMVGYGIAVLPMLG